MISDCCRFSKTICRPEWCKLFPIRLTDFVVTPPCFYSNKLDYFAIKYTSDSYVSIDDSDNAKLILNCAIEICEVLEDTLKLIKIKSML